MSQTTFSLGREELVFVKAESALNTLVVPAASNVVMVTEPFSHNVAPELIKDPQKRDTMSYEASLKGRYLPGTWSLRSYLKPSGGATTAPEVAPLLEAGLGATAVDVTDRLRYGLGTTFGSLSIWRKIGHTVYAFGGCIVQQIIIDISGEDFASIQFSGQFAQRYFAGYSAATSLVAAAATTVSVTAGTGDRFSVGSYIQLGSDTNTGAGYKITSISTDTITFTPGAATGCASAAVIRGLYPSTYTEVGDPVHGKIGQATLNSSSWNILTGQITINTGLKLYDNIKNNSLYAGDYGAPSKRTVEASITAYHDYANTEFHSYLDAQTNSSIIIPVGSTAPNIWAAIIPYFETQNDPSPSGDEEQIQTFDGQAVASSSHDDEFKLIHGKATDS